MTVISLPVQNFNNLANNLVVKIINNTDSSYHTKLSLSLLSVMEALYDEKKRGKQESFKSKILYKISYLLAIILYKTTDVTKTEIFNRLSKYYREGNSRNEMIYILF